MLIKFLYVWAQLWAATLVIGSLVLVCIGVAKLLPEMPEWVQAVLVISALLGMVAVAIVMGGN